MLKARYKLLIVVLIAMVVTALYFVDVAIAASYTIEVISVSPDKAPADGHTPVTLTLQVTHGGKAASNHTIYGLTKNGGSFKSVRLVTDEQGEVSFTYYPYLKTTLNTLKDVTLRFRDESNSEFISVPVQKEVTVKIVAPTASGNSSATTDSIFK
jgi:hypothetical protein